MLKEMAVGTSSIRDYICSSGNRGQILTRFLSLWIKKLQPNQLNSLLTVTPAAGQGPSGPLPFLSHSTLPNPVVLVIFYGHMSCFPPLGDCNLKGGEPDTLTSLPQHRFRFVASAVRTAGVGAGSARPYSPPRKQGMMSCKGNELPGKFCWLSSISRKLPSHFIFEVGSGADPPLQLQGTNVRPRSTQSHPSWQQDGWVQNGNTTHVKQSSLSPRQQDRQL